MDTLCLPTFIETNLDFKAFNGYDVTNEEPETLNAMLGNITVPRMACIASSGEILLNVLLHRAERIVAVDHCYKSLAAAFTKILLLQQVSYGRLRQLLLDSNYEELQRLSDAAAEHIAPWVKENKINIYGWQAIRKEWLRKEDFSLPTLTKAELDKITFVRGDIRRIADVHGTFDLLYLSNAMEHVGSGSTKPNFNDFWPMLNPGGYLLLASVYPSDIRKNGTAAGLEAVCEKHGITGQMWYYMLWRKPFPVQAPNFGSPEGEVAVVGS